MRLQDRVVIVTGGAHGIGLAYAKRLVKEGARVVVADVDGPGAEEAAQRLGSEVALAVRTDVKDPASAAEMARRTLERFGRIVNISSGTALQGQATRMHYVASKAAVIGLTKCMARELGRWNITVNAIAPGSTLSESEDDLEAVRMREEAVPRRCLQRVERPEDLVGTVVFLLSDDASFITGQTIVVDGGAYLH